MCIWDGYPDQREEETEQAWQVPDDDGWRGAEHFPDWPEHQAGCEYWLYLKWGDQPDAI